MKIAVTLLAAAIGLLSIAAGAAKIALVPEETEFLAQFGFGNALTISFGIVQAVSGILMIVSATRFYGSLIVAAGFALSGILILATGNAGFAGISVVPVVLAGFVALRSLPGQLSIEPGGINHIAYK